MPVGFAGPRAAMRTVRAAPSMVAPAPIHTVRGEVVPRPREQLAPESAVAASPGPAQRIPDPTASWPGGIPPAAVPPRAVPPRVAETRVAGPAGARAPARPDYGAIDPALLSTIIQSGTSLAQEGIKAGSQPRAHAPRRAHARPPPAPPREPAYPVMAPQPAGMPTWGKVALGAAGLGVAAALAYMLLRRRTPEPPREQEETK